MLELSKFTTRRDLENALENELGVTGMAKAALVRETAEFRHAWRISRATEAALAASRELVGEPEEQKSLAGFLLLLEYCGVGGKDGVEGASTRRHPVFQGLGKGRKKAVDGQAWDAAIRVAHRRLVHTVSTRNGTHWLVQRDPERTGGAIVIDSFDHDQLTAAGWSHWLMTLAREGLRRSVQMLAYFDAPTTGRPEEWATMVNNLVQYHNHD